MEEKHNPCPKCGNKYPVPVIKITNLDGRASIRCPSCRYEPYTAGCVENAWAVWDALSDLAGKTKGEEKMPTTRKTILEAAEKCVCNDRQDQYGKPEDSFGAIADLWTAYLDVGREITPVDVAQMMILLKVGRAKENPKHQDNWVDMAGYAACAGEIAADVYGNDS